MKAIGFTEHLPIDNPHSLYEFQAAVPKPHPHDLLVNVAASSVNPVDTYIRKGGRGKLKSPKIIGYDACGIVVKQAQRSPYLNPGTESFTPAQSCVLEAIANTSWSMGELSVTPHKYYQMLKRPQCP